MCHLRFLYAFGLTAPLVAKEHLEFVEEKFIGREEGFFMVFV
jgi:hypothetical protein